MALISTVAPGPAHAAPSGLFFFCGLRLGPSAASLTLPRLWVSLLEQAWWGLLAIFQPSLVTTDKAWEVAMLCPLSANGPQGRHPHLLLS